MFRLRLNSAIPVVFERETVGAAMGMPERCPVQWAEIVIRPESKGANDYTVRILLASPGAEEQGRFYDKS